MFKTRAKSIVTNIVVALVLGAGPVACSGVPSAVPEVGNRFSVGKQAGDYTISAVDHSMLANLDGIKLVSGKGPHSSVETTFDMALEVQGLGLQFEKERTYGYMRVDRTFTNDHTVGVSFRFRF